MLLSNYFKQLISKVDNEKNSKYTSSNPYQIQATNYVDPIYSMADNAKDPWNH